MQSLGIASANFVRATRQESQAFRGAWRWKLSLPLRLACKISGTAQLIIHQMDAQKWNGNSLDIFVEGLSNRNSHKLGFIKTIDTFPLGKFNFIENQSAFFKAFFSLHRNGDIFCPSIPGESFIELVRKTFPNDHFEENDVLATCTPEHSSQYRAPLIRTLSSAAILQFNDQIAAIAAQTVDTWNESQESIGLDMRLATPFFTARIFSEILLNSNIAYKELAEAVHFINTYVVKKFTMSLTKADSL